MPILNSAGAMHAELTAWRRHLHANPELEFDTTLTSDFVADKLRAFGCDEVVTGVGRSGVVGIVRGARGDRRPRVSLVRGRGRALTYWNG